MAEAPRIADQLQRTFHGPAWHGPALLELLNGVDADQAARRPVGSAHTIWELVSHIAAWEDAARGWLAGEIASLPQLDMMPDVDWPPMPSPTAEAWKHAVDTARRGNRSLVKLIQTLDDARLEEIVAGR